jgi:hypothetical protein
MPSFFDKLYNSYFKRILQFGHAGNNGTPTATTNIEGGDGVATALNLSDDVLSVQPKNDDGNALLVKNQAGNNIFTVDTTNSKLLGGASQTALNTNYAYFGCSSSDPSVSGMLADTHYAIPFTIAHFGGTPANFAIGSSTSSSFNDTNPSTSLTISSTAYDVVTAYWYVMDDITIDAVKWFHGADTATGEDTAAHLLSYTVDTDNGSTGGDLSSGTVVADGGNITNAGYEQIYYQSMTIQSADVDAGKVILFTFASDTVNSDYSLNCIVKYHIR